MLQPVQLVTTPSASGHSGPVAFAHLRVKFFNDFDGSQFRPIHRTDQEVSEGMKGRIDY